ncbi:kinase-like domain-containing protein [Mycena filopes]|nr:kinase-like domain-containing protein [Mycena filopes]
MANSETSSSSSASVSGQPRRKWLYSAEGFWVDNQPFLLAQGYQLRPRYRPDWVPSWPEGANDFGYEDGLPIFQQRVIDATRVQDGRKVILKRVETGGNELVIFKLLDSLRSDPRNHTIPVLDIFPMPDSPWSFLVMPYCRRFNYPPFHCRSEFIEAMSQYMEGLQFMHDHNIVHFDIAPQNMMMDESKVVPKGSHFSNPTTHTGLRGVFYWNDRCTVGPVDYFYIDFGLSLHFPNGQDTALHLATLRTFPDIPELSQTVPYNPFKVDIFQLGLTAHKVIDAYPDLETFRPVADAMTATDPNDRPAASEALSRLGDIAATISADKLAEQIWEKDTGIWKKLTRRVLGGYRYDYG